MSERRLRIDAGGAPTRPQAAAILTAAAAVLDDEARGRSAADVRPAAYRSAWRLAGRRDGHRTRLWPPGR